MAAFARIRRVAAALVIALATFVAMPAEGDIFGGFRNSLIRFALNQISVPDTFEIEAEEIEDPEEGFVRLVGVTISDRQGVWMTMDEVVIAWNVSRILRADFVVDSFRASGIEWLRQPNPEDVDVQVREGSALDQPLGGIFDWPRAPIDTRIEEMVLEDFFIAEGVISEESVRFEAEGTARDEGPIQAVTLEAVRTDEVAGSIDLEYARDFRQNTLTLLLQASEEAGGLVADIFGLPNDAASAVMIDAEGPLSDWQLDFEARTTDVFHAAGEAVLSTDEPFTVAAEFFVEPGPQMSPQMRQVLAPRATLDVRIVEDEAGVIRIEEGSINAPDLNLTASGSYVRATGEIDGSVELAAEAGLAEAVEGVELGRFTFEGDVEGTMDDLTATGALNLARFSTELLGVQDARLETVLTVAGSRVEAELDGAVDGIRIDRLSPEQIGAAEISGRIAYEPQELVLEGFSVTSPLMDATASGTVDMATDRAGLDYRLASDSLGVIAGAYGIDASGEMEVTGSLIGPLAAPRLIGDAAFRDLVYAGQDYGRVTVSHDVEFGTEPEGTVDLVASGSPLGPAEIETAFVLTADQMLRMTEMTTRALGVTATGHATVDLADQLATGTVEIESADLAEAGEYLGAPVGGAVTGEVVLGVEAGQQMASAELALDGFTAPGLVVDGGTATLEVADALGTPRIDLDLNARAVTAQGVEVGAVTGTVTSRDDGPAADVALTLADIFGYGVEIPSAEVTGVVTDPFGEPALDLALAIDSVTGEGIRSGEIAGTLATTPGPGRIDLDLLAADLAAFGVATSSARIDATVENVDVPGAMEIGADLALEDLSYQEIRLGRFEGRVETTEALETVALAARLTGVEGEEGLSVATARLDGVIRNPLDRPAADLDLIVESLAYQDDRIGRLEGQVAMPEEGDVLDLDLTASDFAMAGVAGDRAVLDGTVRDPFGDVPKVDADLAVEGMVYQGVRLGTLAGSVDSSEDGERMQVDLALTGVEGDGMTVDAAEVTGTITDPFGLPAVDADVVVRDLAYQDVTLESLTGQVRTTADKDQVTLDVTLNALDSRGLHIDSANIDGVVLDPFTRPKPTAEFVVEGIAYGEDRLGSLRGTVETAEDGERIELDVRLEGAEEGPGAARAAVQATIRDPYTEPLIDADVDIADLRLGDLLRIERMDGTVETTGEGERVTVDLDLVGIAAAGIRVDSAAVDGTVTDPFGTPAVEARIDADGLAYGEEIRIGAIEGTVNSLEGLERVAVDARASDFAAFGLRFDTGQVDGVVLDVLGEPGFEGEIAADNLAYLDEVTIGRIAGALAAPPGLEVIEVDAGFQNLEGYGVSIGTGQVNGVLTDLMGDLGFEGELGAERFGYADELSIGRLSGVIGTDDISEELDLDLNIDDLQGYGISIASGDLAGTVIDPTGTPLFDGAARARQLRYGDYRVERLAAEVNTAEGGERIEIGADLTNISGGGVRVPSAELAAVVRDALTEPVIEAELAARDAAFQGYRAAALEAEATITDVADGSPSVAGTATATGVDAAGAAIGTVELTYDLQDIARTPTGTVEAVGRNIAVAGITAARADMDARLTEAAGATNLVADLALANVDVGPATIERVTAEAAVRQALSATPVVSLRARTTAADFGFARIQGISLAAEGPISALEIAVSTAGERVLYDRVTDPLGFEARATLDLTRGLTGQLTAADLVLGDERFRLTRPLEFATVGGITRLEGIELAIPGGTLAGDIALHPGGVVGDIGAIVTDPMALSRFTPLPEMIGRIVLAADFDTRPGQAGAQIALDATALRFEDVYEDFGDIEIDLDLAWDGELAQLTLDIAGPFEQPVVARLALPLRPTGGLIPAMPAGAPIDGRLVWEGDVGTIWPLVPLTDHVLDGPVAIDLRLSGPISGPEVSGQVTMTDGRYENLEFGTILTDFTVRSEIRPGGAFALDLVATDAADSLVTGQVILGPEGIDARITAEDAILVRRDDLTAALTVDVTVQGPLDAPHVAGEMVVNRAEARLVNVTPPSVVTLGDVRIKGVPRPPPRPARGSLITLDVTLRAPDDLYIRGRGLDSEWEAALRIGGTAASPEIVGEVQRIRGQLTLLGRDFDLEEGVIDFAGVDPINPRLNIRLVRDEEDITGGMWVHGRARDIEVDFFSTPALPEEEVLPRLLFGRSRQSLSALEAVQLAAGVATLLDGTGGVVEQVRSAIGVDVLRLEGGAGEEGPAVTIGRNIAQDVFVGVQQPIGGGPASVEVEVEIFDNVQVESQVGGEKGSSVGVQWKKDF